MDVAKYIGLFLLKNHFCYIHGLGNLELRKRAANYDGTALQAPSYEIIVTPVGSIDDNLANFIATNEQTSISKASNALRDFSTQSRSDLQAGKDVLIPNLGKFVEENGKIHFVTDPHFQYTPPGIPTLRNSKRIEDAATEQQQPRPQFAYNPTTANASDTPPSNPGGSVNWLRVAVAVVILLIIIALGFGVYTYLKGRHTPSSQTQNVAIYNDTTVKAPKVDTAQVKVDSTAVASMNSTDSLATFKMVIDNYSTKKKADKRAEQMKSYGHDVTVIAEDSTSYLIVMAVKCKPVDTSRVMDSLSHIFNPAGVTIF